MTGHTEAIPDDALDGVLRGLYEVISFPQGGEPDWPRMEALFSPHARFTRVTPEGTDHVDLRGFRELAQEMLDMGVYTSFHEREITREVRRFGAVAHVLSAYETKQHAAAVEPFARGVNSIQLIHEDGRWQVLSLLWDEEGPATPLLLDALFGGAA